MYTRCTACHTVHPVNAGLLGRAAGQYRCGKCKKVCNALDSLFDEWPDAGERPPAAGEMPVLGLSIDLEKAKKAKLAPGEAGLAAADEEDLAPPARSHRRLLRITWITLALLIAGFLVVNLSEFLGKPLHRMPAVRTVQSWLGIEDSSPEQPFRDLERIQLVSRELKSHPIRPWELQLTATIVNRADQVQPYPELEVVFLDAGGQELSKVRYKPSRYLPRDKSRKSGMTPQAYLPLVLDLPDPGEEAVGFELNFH